MPTLSRFQSGVLELLKTNLWADLDHKDQVQKAKDIVLSLAARSQRNSPDLSLLHLCRNIERITENFVAGIPHSIYLQKLVSAYQQLSEMLNDPIDEDEVRSLHSNMDEVLERFSLAQTERIFPWLLGKVPTIWHEFFMEKPSDIAFLIKQRCREILDHKGQIPNKSNRLSLSYWLKEQIEQPRIFKLAEQLTDLVLYEIPKKPLFCTKSDGGWCILDQKSLESLQIRVENCRKTIEQINSSGPTGIGYAVANLDDDATALDRVLAAWDDRFPMEQRQAANTEFERLKILLAYEGKLDEADVFLDDFAIKALPKKIAHIPRLTIELEQYQAQLGLIQERENSFMIEAALREDVERLGCSPQLVSVEEFDNELERLQGKSVYLTLLEETEQDLMEIAACIQTLNIQIGDGTLESVQEKISLTEEQLRDAQEVYEQIDVDALKRTVFEHVRSAILLPAPQQVFSASLLSIAPNFGFPVLREEQLLDLVGQAVDDMIAREYQPKGLAQGQFRKHLDVCRERQLGEHTNCDFNLHTEGKQHFLTEGRVRSLTDARQYVQFDSDGEHFRDVIIGGCLLLLEADASFSLSENMADFFAEDPGYPSQAKRAFEEFSAGRLVLPPAQMDVLNSYVLTPRYDLLPQMGYFTPRLAPNHQTAEEVPTSAPTST